MPHILGRVCELLCVTRARQEPPALRLTANGFAPETDISAGTQSSHSRAKDWGFSPVASFVLGCVLTVNSVKNYLGIFRGKW
uniref:Uncharacterized protein n=1 Tax=Prolemur simus TaxID=1328070 RepID=A0A8C8Z018_PROSS